MNFRRIVMVSGSHLLKRVCTTVATPALPRVENYHLWRRSCTTSTSPLTEAGVKADLWVKNDASAEKAKVAAREQRKKRKMYKELQIRIETGETVQNTLNAFIKREEEEAGVSITEKDLFRWAKHLNKLEKHEHACQIYEWMEEKKLTIPPPELATYLGLINKTKGVEAAEAFFKRVDPDFISTDASAKNWPAFLELRRCYQNGPDIRTPLTGGNRCIPAVMTGGRYRRCIPAVMVGPNIFTVVCLNE